MNARTRSRLAAVASGLLLVAASPVGCGGSHEETPSGPIPLADALPTLEPNAVWQHFYDLTQVPRTSHDEHGVTALVADFGRSLGLETIVYPVGGDDGRGNVIIRSPATPGMEGRPIVVLQAHLDMVGIPKDPSVIDWQNDPVNALVEDGWVHADGTTLGADDGIGIAVIMALLEAKDVPHGPIEALFTVNEEDGLEGINALATDVLQGRRYVNVDNELEGQFIISSAGAVDVHASRAYDEVPTPAGTSGQLIAIGGLIGGHSGNDIDKGRGSAHQLLADLLVHAPAELEIRVAEVVGGETPNAIPSEATALVALPTGQVEALRSYVASFEAQARSELPEDPGVTVTTTAADLPAVVMEATAQDELIRAVYDAPQGVWAMAADPPDMVETSGNLGVLNISAGQFTATAKVRSAEDAERDAHAQRYVAVFDTAHATTLLDDAYTAWPPNPDSPLLALMEQVYLDTFGAAPDVAGIHAGLETSVTGEKYPGMDMISVGATIVDLHTAQERVEIASVARLYELLVATLAAIE